MTECKHLVEQAACADCRPRPAQAPAAHGDPALYGPWFLASYDGECDGCGEDILTGDRIRADGQGGWICKDCGEPDGVPGGDLVLQGRNVTELQVIRPPAKPTIGEFMSGAGGPGFSDGQGW